MIYNNVPSGGGTVRTGSTRNTPYPGQGTPERRKKPYTAVIAVAVIVMIIAAIVMIAAMASSGKSGAQSTYNRVRLEGVSFTSDCVDDGLGWIAADGGNVKRTGEELKAFWEATGIQPVVALVEWQNGWDDPDTRFDYADIYFENEVGDEGALLLMYFDTGDPDTDGWWEMVRGLKTDSVMDAEATEIFWGYLDRYWSDPDRYTSGEAIANTFTQTGKAIMTKATTGMDVAKTMGVTIAIIVAAAAVIIVMCVKRKHDSEANAETERILSTPLEQLGAESDPLVNQYSGSDGDGT